MIGYSRKVQDIFLYDVEKLKSLMGADRAHKGNGMLVFEFDKETLSEQERAQITTVMDNYIPGNNAYHGKIISCSEDIDRITGERVRLLFKAGGSGDPIQAQLKILTEVIAEIKAVLNIQTKYDKFFTDRDQIITEGKEFKKGKGW